MGWPCCACRSVEVCIWLRSADTGDVPPWAEAVPDAMTNPSNASKTTRTTWPKGSILRIANKMASAIIVVNAVALRDSPYISSISIPTPGKPQRIKSLIPIHPTQGGYMTPRVGPLGDASLSPARPDTERKKVWIHANSQSTRVSRRRRPPLPIAIKLHGPSMDRAGTHPECAAR